MVDPLYNWGSRFEQTRMDTTLGCFTHLKAFLTFWAEYILNVFSIYSYLKFRPPSPIVAPNHWKDIAFIDKSFGFIFIVNL